MTGKNGTGERNNNGVKLVAFCNENELVITGTLFQHKNIHKNRWTSPDFNTYNQIDHILVNGKYRRSSLDTKVRRGADIGSDCQLVFSKVQLKQKEPIRRRKLTSKDMM